MVKVSVVIPVLNDCRRLEHFKNTIYSLEKQNFTDYEKIVVLNGKDKGSDELLKFAKEHADKVLKLKQSGVSNARNQGVKHADGDFLVIVDDHVSFSSKNVLEEIVEVLEKGDYTGTCSMKPDREGFVFWFVASSKNFLHEVGNFSYPFYRFGVAGSNGLIYCRKDFFNKMGGFNKDMNSFEIYDFFDRAVREGAKYKNIDDTYITYDLDKYKKNGLFGVWGYWVKETFKHSNKYSL